jgi:hypothetical protein
MPTQIRGYLRVAGSSAPPSNAAKRVQRHWRQANGGTAQGTEGRATRTQAARHKPPTKTTTVAARVQWHSHTRRGPTHAHAMCRTKREDVGCSTRKAPRRGKPQRTAARTAHDTQNIIALMRRLAEETARPRVARQPRQFATERYGGSHATPRRRHVAASKRARTAHTTHNTLHNGAMSTALHAPPKEPEPIFLPSLYFLPTRSSMVCHTQPRHER